MTVQNDTSEPPTLIVRFQALAKAVEQTRAALAEGRNVDLTGMEEHFSALCDKVSKSSVDEAKAISPILHELIEALDRLETDLRATHAERFTDTPSGD
ncbi:MAG: hypothetical protein U9N14_00245 [Pseudomonadota bacterium]|nr:hypothetical protein [Pseudomonadota bacterium]